MLCAPFFNPLFHPHFHSAPNSFLFLRERQWVLSGEIENGEKGFGGGEEGKKGFGGVEDKEEVGGMT